MNSAASSYDMQARGMMAQTGVGPLNLQAKEQRLSDLLVSRLEKAHESLHNLSKRMDAETVRLLGTALDAQGGEARTQGPPSGDGTIGAALNILEAISNRIHELNNLVARIERM